MTGCTGTARTVHSVQAAWTVRGSELVWQQILRMTFLCVKFVRNRRRQHLYQRKGYRQGYNHSGRVCRDAPWPTAFTHLHRRCARVRDAEACESGRHARVAVQAYYDTCLSLSDLGAASTGWTAG